MRAGDEDRTRIASLEGWSSAIELHPRVDAEPYGSTPSGRGDLNPRPPAPKACQAVFGQCRHVPSSIAEQGIRELPGTGANAAARTGLIHL